MNKIKNATATGDAVANRATSRGARARMRCLVQKGFRKCNQKGSQKYGSRRKINTTTARAPGGALATLWYNTKSERATKMSYEEAKRANAEGVTIYRAYYDGRVWSAGGMRDVGETIGYYASEKDARDACADYELFDFDREHCETFVEMCDAAEFEEA